MTKYTLYLGYRLRTKRPTDLILGSFDSARQAESNEPNIRSVGHLVLNRYPKYSMIFRVSVMVMAKKRF